MYYSAKRQTFLVEGVREGVLDLAADLDLVGEVELGVKVGNDALLDAELGVAE